MDLNNSLLEICKTDYYDRNEEAEALKSLRRLINRGADVNCVDDDNWSPLHLCCHYGRKVKIASILIDYGANIELAHDGPDSYDTWKALHLAAAIHLIDIVTLLLDRGADVNSTCESGSALHLACSQRGTDLTDLTVASLLVQRGANINIGNEERGQTILHSACNLSNVTVATFSLDIGIDIHSEDKNGMTPLDVACKNDIKMVKFLLNRGANVNRIDRSRKMYTDWTALHHTCFSSVFHKEALIDICKIADRMGSR